MSGSGNGSGACASGWEYSRNAQTTVQLYTGGKGRAGDKSLFIVYGGALEILHAGSGNPSDLESVGIANHEISFGSLGSPKPNEVLYAALPEGETVDFTRRAAGKEYYEGQPSTVTKHKLVIMRGFEGGWLDVSNLKNKVVVGQGISLDWGLDPDYAPRYDITSKLTWSIPGYAVAGYTADSTHGVLDTNINLTDKMQSTAFYWVDGGIKEVQLTVVIGGQTLTAKTTFEVIRPTAEWIAEANATVSADDNYSFFPALHFGYRSSTNKGMLFKFQNLDLKGYQGNWVFYWAQLAGSYVRGNFLLTNNVGYAQWRSGLDKIFPAGAFSAAPSTDQDDPAQSLSGTSKLQRQDSFTNYLMFKPFVSGSSIPVPIKRLTWSWSGTATNATSWLLLSSPSDFSISLNNSDTLEFPTWTNNVTNATTIYTNWF